MNRMKLGEILSVKHGWALRESILQKMENKSILTPGNFF